MTFYFAHGSRIQIDDCYFEVQPLEIGVDTALPVDYQLVGNKRERVRLYGGAVSPLVMRFLIGRTVEALGASL